MAAGVDRARSSSVECVEFLHSGVQSGDLAVDVRAERGEAFVAEVAETGGDGGAEAAHDRDHLVDAFA